MPTPLPYIPSYGKIKTFFAKAASAKVPDSFTHAYLAETLGLKSTSDRPLIPLLRQLGLLDASNKPTAQYATLKNPSQVKKTIARATKRAFAPLFAADEKAHLLDGNALKGLVAQVAGTDDDVTKRTVGTFQALVELSDFSSDLASMDEEVAPRPMEEKSRGVEADAHPPHRNMKPEFHYNIQVHLPSNATEETYLNIFNALRRAFS